MAKNQAVQTKKQAEDPNRHLSKEDTPTANRHEQMLSLPDRRGDAK